MKIIYFSLALLITWFNVASQTTLSQNTVENQQQTRFSNPQTNSQFISTSYLLDAAMNSFNSLNSLIKKENYRNKITSFNNPTSSDMGFNLENEIQTALKPLLLKAKTTNTDKFSHENCN